MSQLRRTDPLPRPINTAMLVLLVPIAADALAEETALAPIVVEAQIENLALPGAVNLDANAMQQLAPATSDTASLLRAIPGVDLNYAGGLSSQPSMHGLAADRLRIKVDGMDLIASCPNQMNPPLSYLDPSNVGDIQAFVGVTPVSVGGDSIGGTILVDTPTPEFASSAEQSITHGSLGTFYRSNNNAYGGTASALHASDAFSIRYNGSWSRADNYSAGGNFKTTEATGRIGHTLPLDEVGSTAYRAQNHSLGMAWRNQDQLIELDLGYQNMPEQLYPNQRMDLLNNEEKRASLAWTGDFGWGTLEASGYYEEVDHFMDFGADKRTWFGSRSQPPLAAEIGTPCSPVGYMTCADGMPMYSEGRTGGAKIQADIDLNSGDLLRLGAEYHSYHLDDYWTPSGGGMWPNTFQNINDGRRDRGVLFAEWEAQLNEQWRSLLGLRYERVVTDAGNGHGYAISPPQMGNQIAEAAAFNAQNHKKTDNNLDLSGLLNYTPNANLDLQFGLARKVRSPNLYERYTWSTWTMAAEMNNFAGDGNGYVGDINLKPETAYTASVSFDWHAEDRAWELRATPYISRVDDFIDAVPVDPLTWQADAFNVLQYSNQSARLYGIDLSGQVEIARTNLGNCGLEALVGYTNGKNRDTGDGLYNIMPWNGTVTLTHRKGGWDNALELVMVDTKDHLSEVRNEIETAGYSLVNLRLSHTLSLGGNSLRLDLGVENLFDRFYDLPTGGAYLGQGSTMSINGVAWGTAVPGMGRSFYAGITMTF